VIGISGHDDLRAATLLGRTSAMVKLGIVMAWLAGVIVAPQPGASLALGLAALAAAWSLGGVPVPALFRGLVPLLAAACGIAFFTAIFAAANSAPGAVPLVSVGPIVF
jgi:hypothetical protein